jgi:hypothetical protein
VTLARTVGWAQDDLRDGRRERLERVPRLGA